MNYDEQSVNRKLEELNSQSIKYRRKFSTIAGTLILVTVLSASVIAASVGYGMLRGILDNTPEFDPNRVVPTGFYSVIYNSRGDEAERLVGSNANRVEAKYDEFPQDLVDAFVAIEDSRFWQHEGIDFRSILRAITGILTDSYSGGGSTITQQLIKNTVFEGGMENSGGARLERKIQEQYLALQLTKTMDRKTILTNYLNTINLGNDTLGVKSAAMRYFGKDVADLTLSECAVIAGITQNPSRYNPITHPEENNSRREVILGEMYRQGYITREEQDMALSDKVYDRIQNVNVETTGHRSAYSYYTDELIEQVKDALKERYGYTDTQAYNMIYTGGLRIYTPQDPDLQAIVDEEMKNPANYDAERFSAEYRLSVKSADGTTNHYSQEHLHRFIRQSGAYPGFDGLFNTEEELKAWVEQYRNSVVTEQDTVLGETLNVVPEPQASFVLIEQSTGYVRAISGGRGEKNASRTLNRATDTLRQPGSTFKIITTFAPALDTCGATLATTYYDAPYSFGSKVFKNWWGDNWTGYQNIRDGIIYSMNIVALKCMAETVRKAYGNHHAFGAGSESFHGAGRHHEGRHKPGPDEFLCDHRGRRHLPEAPVLYEDYGPQREADTGQCARKTAGFEGVYCLASDGCHGRIHEGQYALPDLRRGHPLHRNGGGHSRHELCRQERHHLGQCGRLVCGIYSLLHSGNLGRLRCQPDPEECGCRHQQRRNQLPQAHMEPDHDENSRRNGRSGISPPGRYRGSGSLPQVGEASCGGGL